MLRIITVLAAFLLAACTATPSPQETMSKLNQRYVGHNADDFFLSYGDPVGKTSLKSGGTLYRWASTEAAAPPAAPAYRSYTSPQGRFPMLQPSAGASGGSHYCELQIQTDKKGIIRNLSMVTDSPGKWSTSRCAE